MNKDTVHRNRSRQKERANEYPQRPRVERSYEHVTVLFDEILIADSRNAFRVLEKGHPPAYYIPSTDVRLEYFVPGNASSICEWKGRAGYFSVIGDRKTAKNAVWYYSEPNEGYEELTGCIAFYPQLMDSCRIDGDEVGAQKGSFYGGWITADVEGPFKGDPSGAAR